MRVVILLILFATMPIAHATAYVFPGGPLPAGCSGSGPAYTCSGSVTLNSGDTITINSPKPATITINGDLTLNSNPQINSAGTAVDLKLIISGQLRAGPGSVINANVTASRVDAISGSVTYGGSLTTTGDYVALRGASYVNGSINAKSYVDTGAGTQVTGLIISGSYAAIGTHSLVQGSITTSGAGYIYIDSGSTVNGALTSATGNITLVVGTSSTYSTVGSISTGGSVYLDSYNRVTGDVTGNSVTGTYYNVIGGSVQSGTQLVYFNDHVTVTGNIVSTGSYVQINSNGNVGGNITAGTYVYIDSNTNVVGNVTADTSVQINNNGNVGGNITSGTTVYIYSNGSVGGNITAGTYVTIVYTNHIGGTVTALGGPVYIYSSNTFDGNVTASGLVSALDNNVFSGDVTSQSSYVYIATGDTVSGNVTSTTTMVVGVNSSVAGCARSTNPNTMTLYTPSLINGACCGTDPICTNSCMIAIPKPPACSSLHHLVIQHASGAGLTCTPSTVTIVACANAACSSYYTGGVTGTLTATGSGMTVNYPSGAGFTIGSGSSSTTVALQVTKAGSVVLGTSASGTSCNFGSPSCTLTAADSGLLFDVPNHVSNVAQTVSVSAVKKSDNSLACTPAFANVSKSVSFSCAYSNPTTGTLPVVVGGAALNAGNNSAAACDGNARAVSLSFNASGVASTSVQYADVGQMSLNASLTGSGTSAGLVMTGTDNFIAAPASFAFSNVTAAPIKAGASFSATVTAKNNSGNTTPNFGRETSAESVRLTWSKYQPTGTGAVAGTFSGTGVSPSAALGGFSSGAATVSNLSWTEVGTGDLNAALTSGSYLGSGFTATGSTGSAGSVGRFTPDHFDTVISTQACDTFTYSGQPFTVQILARNASGDTTLNYDGTTNTSPNFAKAVTLSAATNGGTGSLTGGAVALTSFTAGVASVIRTPTFTFTNKLTPATSVSIRAADVDSVSSSGHNEGSALLRSGRLRLFNAFGSEKAALQIPVQTQYWSGKSWVINGDDSCTNLPTSATALSAVGISNSASAISLNGGNGVLTLGKPNPQATGYVDVATNLGTSGSDVSCLATHGGVGAGLPWLRSQNGGCAATYDRDPSARATFGIYSAETRKTIHIRELY